MLSGLGWAGGAATATREQRFYFVQKNLSPHLDLFPVLLLFFSSHLFIRRSVRLSVHVCARVHECNIYVRAYLCIYSSLCLAVISLPIACLSVYLSTISPCTHPSIHPHVHASLCHATLHPSIHQVQYTYTCTRVQKDMYYIETLKYNTGKDALLDSLAHLLGPCIYFFQSRNYFA